MRRRARNLEALPTGGAVCLRRGHHGPFANLEKYREVPGWEGMGDCQQCGSTVRTGGEDCSSAGESRYA